MDWAWALLVWGRRIQLGVFLTKVYPVDGEGRFRFMRVLWIKIGLERPRGIHGS